MKPGRRLGWRGSDAGAQQGQADHFQIESPRQKGSPSAEQTPSTYIALFLKRRQMSAGGSSHSEGRSAAARSTRRRRQQTGVGASCAPSPTIAYGPPRAVMSRRLLQFGRRATTFAILGDSANLTLVSRFKRKFHRKTPIPSCFYLCFEKQALAARA